MAEIEVKAVARYERISPQKVHKIIGAVKNIPVEDGINKLHFMPQKAARLVEKVLNSAVANAEANHDIDIDDLMIQNITADQGPTLKRFRARARGRGTQILKRTSHITVVLTAETV
jgi:large subunit ribosomal protein L22